MRIVLCGEMVRIFIYFSLSIRLFAPVSVVRNELQSSRRAAPALHWRIWRRFIGEMKQFLLLTPGGKR
jgi:hypothetical protein